MINNTMVWQNFRKALILSAIAIMVFSLNACCACGTDGDENIMEGVITVIGNEPFAKLALNIDDNKYYVLDCPDDLRKELMNSQGKLYKIEFSETYEKENLPYLKVENAVLLKAKSKK